MKKKWWSVDENEFEKYYDKKHGWVVLSDKEDVEFEDFDNFEDSFDSR